MEPSRPLMPWRALVVLAICAAGLRGMLARVYWGHEEEDWSNLATLVGTWQAPLENIELEHMPFFASLGAMAFGLVGDAQLAGTGIAILAGSAAVFALGWLGVRAFGTRVGLVGATFFMCQPESALYSSTPLREGPYALLTILGVGLVGLGRGWSGGVLLALGFLTRFNVMFTLLPPLLFAALFAPRSALGPAARRAALLVILTICFWSAVYHQQEGTWAFWERVVDRNMTGVRDHSFLERLRAGWDALIAVGIHVLPAHLGTALLPLSLVGLAAAFRGVGDVLARWIALCGLTTGAFFLVIVVGTAYDWDHNLYWKHLASVAPWACLFGALGLERLWSVLRDRPWLRAALVASTGLATALTWGEQFRFQIDRSDRWYGTQVRLVRWVEGWLPPDHGVVANLIPASYLGRRPGAPFVHGCTDPEVPQGDLAVFGTWAVEQRIAFVFWFREDWVGCGLALPELADRRPHEAGPVRLVPVAWEPEYGVSGWVVEGLPGLPPRPPVPRDAGAIGLILPRDE